MFEVEPAADVVRDVNVEVIGGVNGVTLTPAVVVVVPLPLLLEATPFTSRLVPPPSLVFFHEVVGTVPDAEVDALVVLT